MNTGPVRPRHVGVLPLLYAWLCLFPQFLPFAAERKDDRPKQTPPAAVASQPHREKAATVGKTPAALDAEKSFTNDEEI